MAQADVERLELQLAFQEEELERTRIRAPLSGVVVTPNLHLMQGQYLDEGETLLEIERTDTVLAEIAIPEADIGLVEIGDPVRLKTYGKSEEEVGGSVFSIAPVAEQRDFGRVVRLVAVFDNAEGLLRSDMTGFAKVEGDEMPVWRAFLRRAVRFFEVDVWSWIP